MARRHRAFRPGRAHKHPQLAQITFWTCGRGLYRIEEQAWSFSAPAASFVPSGRGPRLHHRAGHRRDRGVDRQRCARRHCRPQLAPLETPASSRAARGSAPAAPRRDAGADPGRACRGARRRRTRCCCRLIAVALSNLARLRAGAPALAVPAALALASTPAPPGRPAFPRGLAGRALCRGARHRPPSPRQGGAPGGQARGQGRMVSERRLVEAKRPPALHHPRHRGHRLRDRLRGCRLFLPLLPPPRRRAAGRLAPAALGRS